MLRPNVPGAVESQVLDDHRIPDILLGREEVKVLALHLVGRYVSFSLLITRPSPTGLEG